MGLFGDLLEGTVMLTGELFKLGADVVSEAVNKGGNIQTIAGYFRSCDNDELRHMLNGGSYKHTEAYYNYRQSFGDNFKEPSSSDVRLAIRIVAQERGLL